MLKHVYINKTNKFIGGITMENVFSNLDTAAPVETEKPANAARKEKIAAMKEAIKTTISEDPTFVQKLRSLSDSIEVVNTLGFGDSGNIVVDRTKTDERSLAVTSAIVGYRVRNLGSEPIKYTTEIYAQDETGKYVGTKQEMFLAPGATADLTRQYMTMLAAIPEISFQLANGKIIRGSGAKGEKSLKAELEAYYFSFNKDENGVKLQVNDDSVKLNVGEKVNGKWVVKPEFVETFGFLNNPKEGRRGGRKSSGEKYNAQDMAANYINRLIKSAEM